MPTAQKYIVRDNGRRCFMPPCFSWDVTDMDGGHVFQASALDTLVESPPLDIGAFYAMPMIVEATVERVSPVAEGADHIVLLIQRVIGPVATQGTEQQP